MLLYFILGVLLVSFILPLLENISSIISGFAEYVVYILALKIHKIKQQINPEENDEEEKAPIGFQTTAIGYELKDTEEENDIYE